LTALAKTTPRRDLEASLRSVWIQEAVNEVIPAIMDEIEGLKIRMASLEASLGDGGL